MTNRTLLSITGSDRIPFLQGLVSNDLSRSGTGIVYAALLTPQGKYLADFFLVLRDTEVILDVASPLAPMLAQRLSMYKLRADVQIAESPLKVRRGTGTPPRGALPDPRDPAMGWRLYGAETGDDGSDWDAIRVAHLIPETGVELTPETYILEAGFERLHGVDFRKGCYVGQEVTARMKHKTELRKGLVGVRVEGEAATGTPIMAGEREAGVLLTRAGDHAIAYLRHDWATGEMSAGAARVTLDQAR